MYSKQNPCVFPFLERQHTAQAHVLHLTEPFWVHTYSTYFTIVAHVAIKVDVDYDYSVPVLFLNGLANCYSVNAASLHRAFVKLLPREQRDKFGTLLWRDFPGMKCLNLDLSGMLCQELGTPVDMCRECA
jgi:hypothetical protein